MFNWVALERFLSHFLGELFKKKNRGISRLLHTGCKCHSEPSLLRSFSVRATCVPPHLTLPHITLTCRPGLVVESRWLKSSPSVIRAHLQLVWLTSVCVHVWTWGSRGRGCGAATEARCSAPQGLHPLNKLPVAFSLSGCVQLQSTSRLLETQQTTTPRSSRMFFLCVRPCTFHYPFSIDVVLHVCAQTISISVWMLFYFLTWQHHQAANPIKKKLTLNACCRSLLSLIQWLTQKWPK